MPCTYAKETYTEVAKWLENTPIAYLPDGKTPGTKSYERYVKYSKAQTVGEALALGCKPEDLLFDFERKKVWATGGPKRNEPFTLKVVDDQDALTHTDRVLGGMYQRFLTWSNTFRVAEDMGLDRRFLTGCPSLRKDAQEHAAAALAAATRDNRKIQDSDVLDVLRKWAFERNGTRLNVMREGQTWVSSDTLGLIASRTGETLITRATREYPKVLQLLCRWIRDRRPKDMTQDFTFTSINLNFGYAARLHRDGGNVGPSMIKALGDFTGGELNYWPDDNKAGPVDTLPPEGKVSLNLRDGLALFDGNRGHSVEDFEGERYSIVFFSMKRYHKAADEDREWLIEQGLCFPTEESLHYAQSLLPPPRGYGKDWESMERNCVQYWPDLSAAKQSKAQVQAKCGVATQTQVTLSELEQLILQAWGIPFPFAGPGAGDGAKHKQWQNGVLQAAKDVAAGYSVWPNVLPSALAPPGFSEKLSAKDCALHPENYPDLMMAATAQPKAELTPAKSGKRSAEELNPTPEKRQKSGSDREAETTKTEQADKEHTEIESDSKKNDEPTQCKGPQQTASQYLKETYAAVALFTESTKVEFVPHAKRPGTKSYDRYERYSTASNVGEVLALGAMPRDLLDDFEKKKLKVVGGPLRSVPLDMKQVKDRDALSDTELVIYKLTAAHLD